LGGLLLLLGCLSIGWMLRARLDVATLNTLALNVALPALALRSMHAVDGIAWREVATTWAIFLVGWVCFTAVGGWLGWSRARTACLTLTAGIGNTSFVGFPVLEALVGAQAIPVAVQIDQLGTFFVASTVGVAVALRAADGERPGIGATLLRIARFPPLLATVLGLATRGWALPGPLDEGLARVGATLAPVALIAVGTRLSWPRRATSGPLSAGLGFKLAAAPAIAWGLASALQVRGLPFEVTVLEAGMAPAATAALLAIEHRLEPELAAAMLGVGVPLSLLTVAVWSQLLP
jgi:predicted permease